jgi:hypothetical protein
MPTIGVGFTIRHSLSAPERFDAESSSSRRRSLLGWPLSLSRRLCAKSTPSAPLRHTRARLDGSGVAPLARGLLVGRGWFLIH